VKYLQLPVTHSIELARTTKLYKKFASDLKSAQWYQCYQIYCVLLYKRLGTRLVSGFLFGPKMEALIFGVRSAEVSANSVGTALTQSRLALALLSRTFTSFTTYRRHCV
jgi:hypothetical protein